MKKNKSHFQVLFRGCLSILIIMSPFPALAQQVVDRDEVVAQKLHCFSENFNQDTDTQWQEVCSLDAVPKPVGPERDQLIQEELDRSARRLNSDENVTSEYQEVNDNPDDNISTESFESESNLFKKGKFELSPETYYYKYTEVIGVKDSGMKYGVTGAYTVRISNNAELHSLKDILSDTNKINVYRIEGRVSYGQVDYKGTGEVNNIPDYNVELRALVGYDIPIKQRFTLTPYMGFGFRYLFNKFSKAPAETIDGIDYSSGYDRESRYFYIPTGAELQAKLAEGWLLCTKAEFDWFLAGKQWSHFEDSKDNTGAGLGYDVLVNEQRKGMGARASMRLEKQADHLAVYFEPYIRYWHIADSEFSFRTAGGAYICDGNLCLGGIEPDNKTWEYGLNVGAKF